MKYTSISLLIVLIGILQCLQAFQTIQRTSSISHRRHYCSFTSFKLNNAMKNQQDINSIDNIASRNKLIAATSALFLYFLPSVSFAYSKL